MAHVQSYCTAHVSLLFCDVVDVVAVITAKGKAKAGWVVYVCASKTSPYLEPLLHLSTVVTNWTIPTVAVWVIISVAQRFIDFYFQFKASYCLLFTLCFLLYSAGWKPIAFMIAHCLIVYGVCAIFKSTILLWVCCFGISLSLQIHAAKIWQVSNGQWKSTSFPGLSPREKPWERGWVKIDWEYGPARETVRNPRVIHTYTYMCSFFFIWKLIFFLRLAIPPSRT